MNEVTRTLPHSIEAEEYLLSCCLIDGADVLARCDAAGIQSDSFYLAAHGIVYRRLIDLHKRQAPIDVAVLAEDLKTAGKLDAVGGYAFLMQVSSRIPTTAQAGYFIDTVRAYAMRRAIIEANAEASEQAYDSARAPVEILAAQRSKLDALSDFVIPVGTWPEPVAASALCAKPPSTPDVLIDGFLYRGATMLIAGPSKSHKTYTMIDASCAIAGGRPWLGFKTVATPVLYLNLELQDFAMAKRVEQICRATGVPPPDNFHPWNLRGRRVTLAEVQDRLAKKIKQLGAGFVVIDPHYKISSVSGMEENSNDNQGLLLSALEGICTLNGAALAICHHFAKGDAGAKNAIDRASGGGVFARWGDVMMTFTPHEEDEAMTVEMALRNFAPVSPFVVRWDHPLWALDGGLDPAKLRKTGRTETNTADKALDALADQLLTFSQWMKAAGMSETTFRRKVNALLDAGRIEQTGTFYRRKAT